MATLRALALAVAAGACSSNARPDAAVDAGGADTGADAGVDVPSPLLDATPDDVTALDVAATADDGPAIDASVADGAAPRRGFVTIRNGRFLLDGAEWHPIGTNYWPPYAQPYDQDSRRDWVTMWGDPATHAMAESVLARDFAAMREHHINEVRIPASSVYTASGGIYHRADVATTPTPAQSYCAAQRRLLDLAQTYGLHVTLNPVVGPDASGADQWYVHPNAFAIAGSQDTAASYVARLVDLIDACHLSDHPALLGYALDHESAVEYCAFAIDPRAHPDWRQIGTAPAIAQWNEWLGQRYQSVAAAERRFGYSLPRECVQPGALACPAINDNGCTARGTRVCPPPNDVLVEGSPNRALGLAFRRFVSTAINRRFQRLASIVRAHDPNHLITAEGGVDDDWCNFCFTFTTRDTSKYLDFVSPHVYHVQSADFVPNRSAFPSGPDAQALQGTAAALAYMLPARRPIVIGEFGLSMNSTAPGGPCSQFVNASQCIASQLSGLQSDLYGFDTAVFVTAGVAGQRWWWWIGQRPMGGSAVPAHVDGENSDYGAVDPAGNPREILTSMRPGWAGLAYLAMPASGTQVATIDLASNVCPQRTIDAARPAAISAVRAGGRIQVRTQCTGRDSATAPLQCADGGDYWTQCDAAHQPCCPLLCLESLFDRVEVQDSAGTWRAVENLGHVTVARGRAVRVRVTVGNLGESSWRATTADGTGAVKIALDGVGLATQRVALPADVGSFDSTPAIEFTAYASLSATTILGLKMVSENRAVFGEPRAVVLDVAP